MDLPTLEQQLRERYSKHNQDHLFQYVSEIVDDERKYNFFQQLLSIPIDKIHSYVQGAKEQEAEISSSCTRMHIHPFHSSNKGSTTPSELESSSLERTSLTTTTSNTTSDYYRKGMEAIQENQVAAVLLAGGQGTRLGYDGPKGMYDIGLPSKKTLFQLIAERIVKLRLLASTVVTTATTWTTVSIPLYIMTSPMNDATTREYFAHHNYFGLPPHDVFFFPQGVLPCLSIDTGKILLEQPDQCSMAPDGNGGIYTAMESCGVLNDMKSRGIQYLHVFSIDNVLVKPADPTFLGYCIHEQADCGNKVVWKTHPHEKVGVMAMKDIPVKNLNSTVDDDTSGIPTTSTSSITRKPCIVEYSEISPEMAEMRNVSDGKLVYGAANICNHFFTLDFIQNQVLTNMKNMYHMAFKKIPVWDKNLRQTVVPQQNNGIKLESFIFDVFPFSTKMAIFEVKRDEEFSPVKNAPGSDTDSPEIACHMMSNLAKVWLTQAGAILSEDHDDNADYCEISPLTSYGGEGLEIYKEKVVQCPFHI